MPTKAQLQNTIKQLKRNKSKRKRSNPNGRGQKATSRIPAAMANTVTGSLAHTRFTGSERLSEVTPSGSSFHCDSKTINSTCAAWLGRIAQLYDRYKFHKLNFRYVTYCGTTTAGEVNLSFDFDTRDAAPTSMIAACNQAVYKSTAAYKNATLVVPVRTAGNNDWKFTADSTSNEKRIVDLGTLHVSTSGFATGASSPGCIYIDYDIELKDKSPF
jgi:hypothetical protein